MNTPTATRGHPRCRPADFPPYPPRGQALVEFALILPLMVGLLLSSVELWQLGYSRTQYQESAGILADALAVHGYVYPSPEFDALASDEMARVGCDRQALTVTQHDVRAVVSLTCQYHPMAYTALAVPVSVEAVR